MSLKKVGEGVGGGGVEVIVRMKKESRWPGPGWGVRVDVNEELKLL